MRRVPPDDAIGGPGWPGLGRRHPATLDDQTPVGRARAAVGLVSLVVFILCFVPNPIVFSWRDVFDEMGIGRLLR